MGHRGQKLLSDILAEFKAGMMDGYTLGRLMVAGGISKVVANAVLVAFAVFVVTTVVL